MSALPEEYNVDYLVYSVSPTISEEETVWHTDYEKVYKRSLFKKFDNWAERKYMEIKSDG